MRFVLAFLLLVSASSARAAAVASGKAWAGALGRTLVSIDVGRYDGSVSEGVGLRGLLANLQAVDLKSARSSLIVESLVTRLGEPIESFLAASPERREALLVEAAASVAAELRAKTDAALYQVENDGYDFYDVPHLHAILGDLVKGYLPYLGEDARRRVLLAKKRLAAEAAAQKAQDLLARSRELAREVSEGTLSEAPTGDWPAGGEPAELTEARLKGLRTLFAGGLRTRPLAAPFWFDALVAGEPAAVKAALDAISGRPEYLGGALSLMGGALASIADSDRPGPERLAVLLAVRGSFAGFLTALAEDETIPASARRKALRARAQIVEGGFMMPSLVLSRRARDEAEELRGLLGAKKTPGALERSGESWRIKPRTPAPRPGKAKEAAAAGARISVDGLSRTIAAARFRLEKLIARAAIVQDSSRFPAGLRRRTKAALKHYRARVAATLDGFEGALLRLEQITFGTALHRRKTRAVLHVTRHPGLRLRPEAGGFVLSARFKTDIQDAKVLAYVKASVEEYWRGEFEFGGTKHRFRTEVEVVPLAQGEAFPEDALRLLDGRRDVAGAHSWGMALDRGGLYFSTPAHEFGHVLGLGDEYLEFYDAAASAGTYVSFPSSLMGDLRGAVLPRHLALVYQLLRRHRLEQP